jgi:uncharacterized glyoxalase superfamily protein PhnB
MSAASPAGRHAPRRRHHASPTADELRGYWGRLSEGGKVHVPLEQQMWGAEFGMCTDRFGIRWMINIGG